MKIVKIISGIIVVAIVVLVAVLLFKSVSNKVTSSKFIYMGNDANLNELNGKAILTRYDDYNKVFGVGGKISEDDFKNNNYEHLGFNLYNESILPRWNVISRLNRDGRILYNNFSNSRNYISSIITMSMVNK